MNANRLTIKAVLLSVIGEHKGFPPLPNASGAKRNFKEMVGLPRNASNKAVLEELRRTYDYNQFLPEFEKTCRNFKLDPQTFKAL